MNDHLLRRLQVVVQEFHTLEEPVICPEDVVAFFRKRHSDDMQESFWVVLCDSRNRITGYVRVSQGTLTASLVHPREVFCIAVREAAASIIIVHNHPSGNPQPSPEDRSVTRRLTLAAKLIGIPLLDHVIVGREGSYSFREHNPDFLSAEVCAKNGE